MAEGGGPGALVRSGQRRDHRRGGEPGLLRLAALALLGHCGAGVLAGPHAAGLPASSASSACCHSSRSTRRKWLLSRTSRNGTPLAILVSQMTIRGLGSCSARARSKARRHGVDVVAVDPLGVPAEGLELGQQRLEAQHLGRGAVGLHVVDVDDGDQVVELVVPGRHRRLPDRALVELAVGEQAVDEGRRLLALQRQAEADRERQAVAQRAAADLDRRACRRPWPTSAAGCRRCRRSPAPPRAGCPASISTA